LPERSNLKPFFGAKVQAFSVPKLREQFPLEPLALRQLFRLAQELKQRHHRGYLRMIFVYLETPVRQ